MTTYPLSVPAAKIALPNGRDWRAMLWNTKVMITGIVSVAVVVVALVLTLGWLAASGADASAILSVVSTLMSVVTAVLVGRMHGTIGQIQQQTNGTQARLIDAAIASQPPERVR